MGSQELRVDLVLFSLRVPHKRQGVLVIDSNRALEGSRVRRTLRSGAQDFLGVRMCGPEIWGFFGSKVLVGVLELERSMVWGF